MIYDLYLKKIVLLTKPIKYKLKSINLQTQNLYFC